MSWMKHTVIMGLPRTGKTTLSVRMFQEIDSASVFVNTQLEDFTELTRNTSTHWNTPAFTVWGFDGNVAPFFKTKTIFNIQNYDDIHELLKKLFEFQQRSKLLEPITIFIDEAHIYFPYNFPIDDKANKHIKMLFTRGSKYNIRLILITQKPQMLCPRLYTLCERMIVFKLHPNDYSYFKRHHINIPVVTEQYGYSVVQ